MHYLFQYWFCLLPQDGTIPLVESAHTGKMYDTIVYYKIYLFKVNFSIFPLAIMHRYWYQMTYSNINLHWNTSETLFSFSKYTLFVFSLDNLLKAHLVWKPSHTCSQVSWTPWQMKTVRQWCMSEWQAFLAGCVLLHSFGRGNRLWALELDNWWLQAYNNRMHATSEIVGEMSEESSQVRSGGIFLQDELQVGYQQYRLYKRWMGLSDL